MRLAFICILQLLVTIFFRTLGDSVMKVLVMLLGEIDLTSAILEDENSSWLTKIILGLFILSMSLVIMNLMVGLAVHDIGALR